MISFSVPNMGKRLSEGAAFFCMKVQARLSSFVTYAPHNSRIN